jgi:hypothetical protein
MGWKNPTPGSAPNASRPWCAISSGWKAPCWLCRNQRARPIGSTSASLTQADREILQELAALAERCSATAQPEAAMALTLHRQTPVDMPTEEVLRMRS